MLVNLIILETFSKFRSPRLFQAHFNLHIFLTKYKKKKKETMKKEREGGKKKRKRPIG